VAREETILSIMQPYLLPYVGYFSLLRASTSFVGLDLVQYIRHGWINRNRILHPQRGWQYFIVPVRKHRRETLIRDVCIARNEDWKGRLIRQLTHYKGQAPFYRDVIEMLDDALDSGATHIGQLNLRALERVCRYLSIPFAGTLASTMDLRLRAVQHAGDWALAICEAVGARGYVNPVGGAELFRPGEFAERGVKLMFLESPQAAYDQGRSEFEGSLSIIDVIMFNSPSDALRLVDSYRLVNAG
jgi:hypothetical protein